MDIDELNCRYDVTVVNRLRRCGSVLGVEGVGRGGGVCVCVCGRGGWVQSGR